MEFEYLIGMRGVLERGALLGLATLAVAPTARLAASAAKRAVACARDIGSVRVLALTGLGMTAGHLPKAAAESGPRSFGEPQASAGEPPWSRTSGLPPPRPLVQGSPSGEVVEGEGDAGPSGHPAIHGHEPETPVTERLFRRDGAGRLRAPDDRRRTMGLHPAGSARTERRPPVATHVVRPGDTLWSIAGRVLETDDVRRIARYWPRIHRHNRETVGPDPNLIFPGQVLELPAE